LARLRFDEEVNQSDIDEAIRLMHVSKVSLLEEKKKKGYWHAITLSDSFSGVELAISSIFEIIRAFAMNSASSAVRYSEFPCGTNFFSMSEVAPRVFAKGYTQQQLDQCLKEYEDLNVWQISGNRTQIRLVS
jgi:DNA replication licensing factor MCM7